MVIGIGFSAIALDLAINGSGKSNPNNDNFIVEFASITSTDTTYVKNAEVDSTDKKLASFDIEGWTTAGQTATITVTVENKSVVAANLDAVLGEISITNSNEAYYRVEASWTGEETVATGDTSTMSIVVTLIKSPTEGEVEGTFTVSFQATAQAATSNT